MNPFQSYPNFNAHLADCLLNPVKLENLSTSKEHQRHLEMQLTLARRQVKFLENQLNAIALLDNMHRGRGYELPKLPGAQRKMTCTQGSQTTGPAKASTRNQGAQVNTIPELMLPQADGPAG